MSNEFDTGAPAAEAPDASAYASSSAGKPSDAAALQSPADASQAPSHGYDLSAFSLGEDDAPMVHEFAAAMRAGGAGQEHVGAALKWYQQHVAEQSRNERLADSRAAAEAANTLRAEWGDSDFFTNKNLIRSFVDGLPAGLQHALRSATTDEGIPLLSDVPSLMWLAQVARGGGAMAPRGKTKAQELSEIRQKVGTREYWKDLRMQARFSDLVNDPEARKPAPIPSGANINAEIAELRRMSAAPSGSPEHRKYWKEGGRARMVELVARRGR